MDNIKMSPKEVEREGANLIQLLSLHRALWNLYIVHSPTFALFIKLGEV